MKNLLSISFIFLVFNLNAQIAQYDFNNNLLDQLNNHDAIYLENGVQSNNPNFVNTPNSTEISLDLNQGLIFPSSLRAEVDTSKSVEIEFTFTVTDVGLITGNNDLWTCAQGPISPGFRLYTYHDDSSVDEDYDVKFSFSDGELGDVPNHPGLVEAFMGTYFANDVINVRLILDFETDAWTVVVNGNYISSTFDNEFDYNITKLKESLIDNDWYFGWHENLENEILNDPSDFRNPTDLLDKLTVYSPRQAQDINGVITALQAMTAHVNGTAPLSANQQDVALIDIYLGYANNNSMLLTEAFNYINAYENNNPPLFENRDQLTLNSLNVAERLLFFLQQTIFDAEYTLANVNNFDGIKYEFSEVFPGGVDPNAIRVTNGTAEVNGTHTRDLAAPVVADFRDAKRPIGYYAPPGEIVSISIPSSMVNAGLSVLIGAHTDDISSLGGINRFYRITKSYPLTTTTTDVISPFGGGLYIQVPLNSNFGYFNVSVDGAVKTPYFSWRNGRETDPSVWAADLQAHNAEWADLESDKYMMTLPLNHLMSITDPTQLMETWDDIMESFRYAGGRPNPRPRSEYFVLDSQLPGEAFGTGYPQVIGDYGAPYGPFDVSILYPTHVLNPNFWNSDFNITPHEMGHAIMHPTPIEETESINHIPAVIAYNQVFDLSMDDAFKYSSGEFLSLDEAAIDWMISFNFRNDNNMGYDPTSGPELQEFQYQHRGFAKYVELAKLLGWDAVYNMNNVFYNDWTANGNDNETIFQDMMLRAASEGNALNVAPLFHFWGNAPSASLEADLESLPTDPAIYNQLVAYYQLVPETQAEFLPYRNRLLARKDQIHFDRINEAYDNYETDNYTQQMRDQICAIMAKYYPSDPPCGEVISTVNLTIDDDCIELHPCPTDGIFTVEGNFQNYTIQILTENGNIHQDLQGQSSPINIDISGLPSGINFIHTFHNNNANLSIQNIIQNNGQNIVIQNPVVEIQEQQNQIEIPEPEKKSAIDINKENKNIYMKRQLSRFKKQGCCSAHGHGDYQKNYLEYKKKNIRNKKED